MNADIIVIEGKGSVADAGSVKKVTESLKNRGISQPSVTNATPDTLSDAFNAALARSNVIVVVGGIGADPEDNAMKTVADVINEDCEMNFSALGKIASSYARSGEDMPESAVKAASVIKGSTPIQNNVGAATGCAISFGSQHIMLLPGNGNEAAAMLDATAGEFLDTAVKSLSNVGDELEFGAQEEEAASEEPSMTFNPDAITGDEPVSDAPAAILQAEPFNTDAPVVEPEPEPAADPIAELISEPIPESAEIPEDFAATTVFASAVEPAKKPEAAPQAAPEADKAAPAEEPEAYVVLTPSKDDKKAQKVEAADTEEEYVDLAEAAKEPEKKQPLGIRILRFFIPWKGDRAVDILRKVVFAVAIVGLVVSSCYIGDFFIKMADNNKVLDEARDLYDPGNNEFDPETHVYNRFDQLIAQNPDCVGWISVPNTKIDNPVYQTSDNDYYLTNNNKKQPSVYGAIFADYRAGITVHGNAKNITLYGHHMKDGTMFANLHNYKKMSFYKENPVISFDTKYGNGGQYKVIGCFITNSDPMDDNGYFFDFAVPNFDSDLDFMNWIEQIRRRSLYDTPVDVLPTDEILTLSTCTYEVKESNLLCVVVARKVRDGETATVNTINTSANSRIIYPAVWYEKLGGVKPTYADGLYTWVSGDYNREDINAPTDTSSLPSEPTESTSSTVSGESSATSSEAASSGSTSTEVTSSGAASSTTTSSGAPASSSATQSTEPTSSAAASSAAASSAAASSTSAVSSTPAASSTPAVSSAAQSSEVQGG